MSKFLHCPDIYFIYNEIGMRKCASQEYEERGTFHTQQIKKISGNKVKTQLDYYATFIIPTLLVFLFCYVPTAGEWHLRRCMVKRVPTVAVPRMLATASGEHNWVRFVFR